MKRWSKGDILVIKNKGNYPSNKIVIDEVITNKIGQRSYGIIFLDDTLHILNAWMGVFMEETINDIFIDKLGIFSNYQQYKQLSIFDLEASKND
ncbi:MAG: hypothetical protein LKF69_04480 [Bacilli bacterium]|jgi:hypothetical protein|nr:hypothetical protein [Bacilli bacterium]MCH4236035.1 hypothetical protein [Bacilli bacterium]